MGSLPIFTANSLIVSALAEHMKRHDFSKWIANVFRDLSLASRVRLLEVQRDVIGEAEIKVSLAKLIWDRYISTAGVDDSSGRPPRAAYSSL